MREMDFSSRDVQPQTASGAGASSSDGPAPKSFGNKKKQYDQFDKNKWNRIGIVVALAAVVILLVALVATISSGNGIKSEDKYVDTTKLQAVFLNTGQVYFGNIKSLNSSYFVVTNIYYLQTANSGSSSSSSSSSANSSVTLVKLGCELHRPYDQMVINSSQVTFWENLQSNGQVATAVATFEKANPNGQKCADQSSSASTTSGSNAQSAGSSSSKP